MTDETPDAPVPFVRYPHLVFKRRGSTWMVRHKSTEWPLILYARDIYYGTGRMLCTLTLDRHDEGSKNPTRVMTSAIDMLTAAQRSRFGKEATERLQTATGQAGPNAGVSAAITTMIDAMLERLEESKVEIDAVTLDLVEVPDDLTPKYVLWPIVPKSRPGMLVAPSGSGKSTTAGAMALSCVTGIELIPGVIPRDPGPVIYIGQEEDAEQMKVRISMMIRGHQLKDVDLSKFMFMKLRGSSLIDSAELIAEKGAEIKAKLVIIDSAQATWGSETEGVRDYATRWFNAVDLLGIPTLIIEHPNLSGTKDNKGAGFAAGTSVKRDRSGHVWGVKSVEIPPQPGHPYRYHVTLIDSKRNYVARQPDITYEVMVAGHEWSRFMPADALTAESVVEGSKTWDAIAAIMRDPDEEHEEGWTTNELMERLQAKDDRRIRQELGLDVWRPTAWSSETEARAVQVEGTGGRGNPGRWILETRRPAVEMEFAPGDDGGMVQ